MEVVADGEEWANSADDFSAAGQYTAHPPAAALIVCMQRTGNDEAKLHLHLDSVAGERQAKFKNRAAIRTVALRHMSAVRFDDGTNEA
jgi:hypothetical protein